MTIKWRRYWDINFVAGVGCGIMAVCVQDAPLLALWLAWWSGVNFNQWWIDLDKMVFALSHLQVQFEHERQVAAALRAHLEDLDRKIKAIVEGGPPEAPG